MAKKKKIKPVNRPSALEGCRTEGPILIAGDHAIGPVGDRRVVHFWRAGAGHIRRAPKENDRDNLRRLCAYGTRGPLSLECLSWLPDGRVAYRMKRPAASGLTELVLEPLPSTSCRPDGQRPSTTRSMKLYGSLPSPYTRKVRLVLLEKGLPHTFVVDPPREPDSQVPVLNPLARIPCLVLEDGEAIYDSPVICEYLDALNDAPVLIPRVDPVARMRVRRWEALADGVMDSALAVRGESLRAPERQDPATFTLHGGIITRALEHAARHLAQAPFLEGGRLSLGDLALLSACTYLDLRQPERDWRATSPALRDWAARLSERSSFKRSLAA